jgi:hypothetical protein
MDNNVFLSLNQGKQFQQKRNKDKDNKIKIKAKVKATINQKVKKVSQIALILFPKVVTVTVFLFL